MTRSLPPPPPTARPLPPERTRCIGRADAEADLLRRIAASRLCTVVGPGGMGKTRLVVRALHALADRGERVWFVEAAEVRDAAGLAAAVGRAAEMGPDAGNAADPIAAI